MLFKLVLGSAKFGEAALFLSIVGGANFVFISFVPVILYFTHVEYFGSPSDIPWAYVCGVSALLLGKTFNDNFYTHAVCNLQCIYTHAVRNLQCIYTHAVCNLQCIYTHAVCNLQCILNG